MKDKGVNFTEEKKLGVYIIGFESADQRLDATNFSQFQEKLIDVLDKGEKHILIDFSNLDYISSAGLKALLSVAKEVNLRHAKLALVALNESVHQIMDISGFTEIFEITETQEQGIRFIGPLEK